MPMARPCDFCLAQTSQAFGTLKKFFKYGWTPTVLISKAFSSSASVGFSLNFFHIMNLVNAYTPASCDRIAGRPFTNLSDNNSASLPNSILIKPKRFCFVEQVDSPSL